MLCLSRKKSEWVEITHGEIQVNVVVVAIQDDKVRLGFEAPDDVVIHRREVAEDIRNDQRKECKWPTDNSRHPWKSKTSDPSAGHSR